MTDLLTRPVTSCSTVNVDCLSLKFIERAGKLQIAFLGVGFFMRHLTIKEYCEGILNIEIHQNMLIVGTV